MQLKRKVAKNTGDGNGDSRNGRDNDDNDIKPKEAIFYCDNRLQVTLKLTLLILLAIVFLFLLNLINSRKNKKKKALEEEKINLLNDKDNK